MADDLCEVVSAYGVLAESVSLFIVPSPVQDAGLPGDAVALTLGIGAGDSASLADDLESNSSAYVVELGQFGDALLLHTDTGAVAMSGGRLSDRAGFAFNEEVEDGGALSDELDVGDPFALLEDVGILSDAAGGFLLASSLTDGGRSGELLAVAKVATLEDAGELADEVAGTVPAFEGLVSAGVFSDEASHAVLTSIEAADGGVLGDQAAATAALTALLEDEASIADFYSLAGAGGAWSASTDTFAMSRWDGIAFNSLAEIDGVLYAAADDGLYRLEPGAGKVPARIRGGLSDFGDPALKRFAYYYAGYQSAGQLRVAVGYVPDGVEEFVSYDLPLRAAAGPTPNRTKLGRGMRSRYWRFTLENVDGAPFALYDQRLIVDGMSRRV